MKIAFAALAAGLIGAPAGRRTWVRTTSAASSNFHNEGGTENRPKVCKLQLRPNPLAN